MARTRSENGVTQVDMVKKALDELGADAGHLRGDGGGRSELEMILPHNAAAPFLLELLRAGDGIAQPQAIIADGGELRGGEAVLRGIAAAGYF